MGTRRTPLPIFEEFTEDATQILLSSSYMNITSSAEQAIENGADLKAKEKIFGNTPLHNAAFNGNTKLGKLLLDNGVKVDIKNDMDETPLMRAASLGKFPMVKFLIDNGAKVKAKDVDGNTALHHAIMGGHKEIVSFLLGKGADINLKNKNNSTPIALTLMDDDAVMAKYLHNKGAKIDKTFKDRVDSFQKKRLQQFIDSL